MKYFRDMCLETVHQVAPCAGAGIEINSFLVMSLSPPVAPCAGAGIEMDSDSDWIQAVIRRPLRGGGD